MQDIALMRFVFIRQLHLLKAEFITKNKRKPLSKGLFG